MVTDTGADAIPLATTTRLAAPVWIELVDYLHRRSASAQPPKPQTVIARHIGYDKAIEASREEYFVAGTETDVIAAKPSATVRAEIAYPGEGSIIALDPDMPDSVQRVRFVAAPPLPGQRWRLDGEAVGLPDQPVLWPPQPGRHDLVLVDAHGKEADRVRFEVRGAARTR